MIRTLYVPFQGKHMMAYVLHGEIKILSTIFD